MSLREEIKTKVRSNGKLITIDRMIDNILKIIEKRVDERIKYYKNGGLVEYSDNLDIITELENVKEILK